MAAWLDCVRFTPTAGGTTDWTYSAAVLGYQGPAAANAVNGTVYRYRAESADLTQWEIGYGAYNSSTGVFSRTTVLYNSSGTTSKISFSTVPQVAIVALKEDMLSVEEANSFTSTQQTQALSNLGLPGIFSAWTAYTPSVSAASGTFGSTTAAGAYLQLGKVLLLSAEVKINTVGSGAGQVFVGLPSGFTIKRNSVVTGRENALNGRLLNPFCGAGNTVIGVGYYDNSSVIAAGVDLVLSGAIETV